MLSYTINFTNAYAIFISVINALYTVSEYNKMKKVKGLCYPKNYAETGIT